MQNIRLQYHSTTVRWWCTERVLHQIKLPSRLQPKLYFPCLCVGLHPHAANLLWQHGLLHTATVLEQAPDGVCMRRNEKVVWSAARGPCSCPSLHPVGMVTYVTPSKATCSQTKSHHPHQLKEMTWRIGAALFLYYSSNALHTFVFNKVVNLVPSLIVNTWAFPGFMFNHDTHLLPISLVYLWNVCSNQVQSTDLKCVTAIKVRKRIYLQKSVMSKTEIRIIYRLCAVFD